MLVIASTATDWIGAGAAVVAALATVAAVIGAIVIGRRQNEISQLLQSLERSPIVLLEPVTQDILDEAQGRSIRHYEEGVARNGGRGPALQIELLMTRTAIHNFYEIIGTLALLAPGESHTFKIPSFEPSDGDVVLSGRCRDIDGNTHLIPERQLQSTFHERMRRPTDQRA